MTTIEMIEDKCEMLIGCKVAEIDALEAEMSKLNDSRGFKGKSYRKQIKALEKQIDEIEEIYGIAQSQDR